MSESREFGTINIDDRGGTHDFQYTDGRHVQASNGLTPSQTIGPFFAYGLTPGAYGYPLEEIHSNMLAGPNVAGTHITIEGQIFDGEDVPVHDAMVEIIQADSNGNYVKKLRNDGFTGYGRMGTGAQGKAEDGGDTRFVFSTIKPGVTQPGSAPYITFIVTMRGLLNHCITRMYFPEDEHDSDPILQQMPEARRQTLIGEPSGKNCYRFDVYMQGENETVFFD